MAQKFDIILLAGRRTGVINPLADAHGVSHKCLVPVVGTSLIERMLAILTSHADCRAVHIVIEAEAMTELGAIAEKYAQADRPVKFVSSNSNIAQSVLDACAKAEAPYIVTTADNVLLSHHSIDAVVAAIANGADAVAAIASRDAVLAVHPEAQRNFYMLRDNGYANCNLYAVGGQKALTSVEIFREGGQFMKNKGRLIVAFGFFNILLLRFRLVNIRQAFRRISKRFKLNIVAVQLQDGTQAVDVDNERTYKVVEMVLNNRIKGQAAD